MTKKLYEQREIYGNKEEQDKEIAKLKKEGWIVVHGIACVVPFGIDEVVYGTLMEREIKN